MEKTEGPLGTGAAHQPHPNPSTANAHIQVPLVDGIDDLHVPWQQFLKHGHRPVLQSLGQHSVVGICTGFLCDFPSLEHFRTFQGSLFRNTQIFCQMPKQEGSLRLKTDISMLPERGLHSLGPV